MSVPLASKNGEAVSNNQIVKKDERPVPPTIAYYDMIFGRMIKICMIYSKEVDPLNENKMWFEVVDCIMDTIRPLHQKKSFAKSYYEDRFYAYIEALVKVHREGFTKLFDHLIKPAGPL
jgi:hypothetical protein